jgi:filamentous hemagglutinin
MQSFGKKSYNLKEYIADANHVVRTGTWSPELNGYVRLIGGKGSAKAAFVGLTRDGANITTFHVKAVRELARSAPGLGWTP